jgi:uncharacterized protein YndB with AHSA1/START domain
MKRKQFTTTIAAPRDAVWNALWNDDSYREWTAPFSPGSHAETDWKKGSKVLFLDGKNSGMVSRIEDVKKNEFMSFKHLGMIKDGVEQLGTQESKDLEGYENYTLETVGDTTQLTVDLQFGNVPQEFADQFDDSFPKALEKLKEVAERNVKVTA